LTDDQRAELKALAELPDSEIDCSDIPPLDEKFWENAVRNPFHKPTKTVVDLDADVLAWLKNQGEDYHTRINTILRKVMLREVRERGV